MDRTSIWFPSHAAVVQTPPQLRPLERALPDAATRRLRGQFVLDVAVLVLPIGQRPAIGHHLPVQLGFARLAHRHRAAEAIDVAIDSTGK